MFLGVFSRLTAFGRRAPVMTAFVAAVLTGCAGQSGPQFGPIFGDDAQGPIQQAQAPIGNPAGVRVGLILPLSATGNAGAAAQSMRNAAELALAEFANPNMLLLVLEDGG
jgi:hypothetical protein